MSSTRVVPEHFIVVATTLHLQCYVDGCLHRHKAARARCEVALEVYDMEGHVFQNGMPMPSMLHLSLYTADLL